jgi:hypothetical protein
MHVHYDLESRVFLIVICLVGIFGAGFAPTIALLRVREGVLVVPSRLSRPSWWIRRSDDAATYWWYFGSIVAVFIPFTLAFVYALFRVATIGWAFK